MRDSGGSFKCYILGDDSLLIQAGSYLLQQSHHILGICTSDANCREFALQHNIPLIAHDKLYDALAKGERFEYLFSLSYKRVVSEQVLGLPTAFAINYHNALLPKYGGVYATSHAIANGEQMHGITYHVMTKDLDKGAILLQQEIPITADETAATLNIKCHAVAMKKFQELVKGLGEGRLTPTPQPKEQASYYSLKDKMPLDALITWDQEAKAIERTFRALQTEQYLNQLGLPKVVIANRIVVPKFFFVTTTNSTLNPGTVSTVNLEENFLQVATKTYDVIIGNLVTMNGKQQSLKTLIEEEGIDLQLEHTCLPSASELGEKLARFSSEHYRDEMYWVSKFAEAIPVKLPYFDSSSYRFSDKDECAFGKMEVSFKPLKQEFKEQIAKKIDPSVKIEEIILATILMVVYRLNLYDEFLIDFSHPTTRASIQGLEQFYSIYLPLSINLDKSISFGEFIKQLKGILTKIFQRASYELDVFQRYPDLAKKSDSSVAIFLGDRISYAKFNELNEYPLTICIAGEVVRLVFNQDKLPKINCQRIAREMQECIETLLNAGLAVAEDKPFTSLPILSQASQETIESNLNGPAIDYSMRGGREVSAIAWFQQIAEKFPDNIAIIAHSKTTYSDLNSDANRLAHFLLLKGIKPGDVVGVYFENSAYFIVAMLAIFKIGATYLPLDPSFPVKHLNFILKDAKPMALITRKDLLGNISDFDQIIVCVDLEMTKIQGMEEKYTSPSYNALGIAYIIYTSGSTGTPKGVKVSYQNLFDTMASRIQQYKPYEKNELSVNLMLLVSTTFDTSIAAILWPLLVGGRLIMSKANQVKDVSSIVKLLHKFTVSHLICVPAIYRNILEYVAKEQVDLSNLQSLRLVVLGGDSWNQDLVDAHKTLAAAAFLFNEYGLTEVSVWSFSKLVYSPETKQQSSIDLGMPGPGDEALILDEYGQMISRGTIGQLYLGGPKVASGYTDLQKTTERFINYTLPSGKTGRWYKTGDLCAFTGNSVEFKGRVDCQVKLRGLRIETGQIEHYISIFSASIKECVVSIKIINKQEFLVGYLVSKNAGDVVDINNLRNFLK